MYKYIGIGLYFILLFYLKNVFEVFKAGKLDFYVNFGYQILIFKKIINI